jgi:type II secretion system protein G
MKNPAHTRTRRSRHSHRGFTLLELLVVILIIGLLTGIVGPRFMSQISRSEATAAKAQIDAFEKALEAYRIDTGRYPSSSQGLQALVNRPADEAPTSRIRYPPTPGARRMNTGNPGAPARSTTSSAWGATAHPAAATTTQT